MTISSSMAGALLSCGLCLSACAPQAQQTSTAGTAHPEPPGPARPASQLSCMAAERQVKAAQEVHQRMKNARTPAERRALMAEHGRALRSAMAAMREMHRDGMAHGACGNRRAGMGGHRMGGHQAMTQAMMDMMMERIDMPDMPDMPPESPP